jgi:SAM-dependent methyltransferase
LSWKSSSAKKPRLSPAQQSALSRLESVRQQRRPFLQLSRRLLAGALARYLPAEGPIVEVGTGDGQLRERLPEAVLSRMTHTEPNAAVSRAYRRRHPQARVLPAAADCLPFEPASLAAVVGLCVLDVVPDGAAVVRELSRVVRPGGRVIHWLDMATRLDELIDSLWSVNLVPFPNIFSDPSEREWPEDLWLVPRAQLGLVVSELRRAASPAAQPLGQYLAVFSAAPTRSGAPTDELVQLQESAELRASLRSAFRTAFELAAPDVRLQLARIVGQPVSTAQHFEAKLRGWFSKEAGFRIEQCGVERGWETTPLQAPELVYRSSLIGEQRHLPRLPGSLLCPDATSDPQQTLVELGIFTFVATRLDD